MRPLGPTFIPQQTFRARLLTPLISNTNWDNYAPYAPLNFIDHIDFIGLENATNVTHKIFNMAEKKADAPVAGMLWGGRFTGSNVLGINLAMQYTDLTVRRWDGPSDE